MPQQPKSPIIKNEIILYNCYIVLKKIATMTTPTTPTSMNTSTPLLEIEDELVLEYMEAGLLKYDTIRNEEIKKYLRGLNKQERIAIKIAREHLETSFNINRSNGFNEWLQNQA